MKRNLLITGSRGQLGSGLVNYLSSDYNITGIDIEEADITRGDSISTLLKKVRPEIVIHSAAYTDVDACETNSDLAMKVNSTGTANIAQACREVGARLIYYSTDYVFDGEKGSAYLETDRPNPRTVYGKSKWEGEKRIAEILNDYAIMRLAWVYGLRGKNFVKTMLKLGADQLKQSQRGKIISPLRVVNDQMGNPTWTMEIARQTKVVLENDLKGVIHSTSEGITSWYHFAEAIFENFGMKVQLEPCTTAEFPRPAPRPRYSALENGVLKAAGLNIMADWEKALKDFTLKHSAELKI